MTSGSPRRARIRLALLAGGSTGGDLLDLGDVDRDREHAGAHSSALVQDDVAVAVCVEQLVGSGDEVGRTGRALEADEIATEQPLDDLLAPWQSGEQLDRRERDVQEEADRDITASLGAQHPGDELQLVVVDPHHRPLRRDARQREREPFVDGVVGIPLVTVVGRLAESIVVERPQRVVREALVVELDLLRADPDRMQVDPFDRERVRRRRRGRRSTRPTCRRSRGASGTAPGRGHRATEPSRPPRCASRAVDSPR